MSFIPLTGEIRGIVKIGETENYFPLPMLEASRESKSASVESLALDFTFCPLSHLC